MLVRCCNTSRTSTFANGLVIAFYSGLLDLLMFVFSQMAAAVAALGFKLHGTVSSFIMRDGGTVVVLNSKLSPCLESLTFFHNS